MGLSPTPFQALFDLSDEELAARGAARRIADEPHAFPCRVSLEDAAVGEELLLLPFRHHDCRSPYQAAGPIYVRRNAREIYSAVNTIPEQQRRLLFGPRLRRRRMDGGADVTPGDGPRHSSGNSSESSASYVCAQRPRRVLRVGSRGRSRPQAVAR